jgi:signal transduction histidine kinase
VAEAVLTREARRYIRILLNAIGPVADSLERRFRIALRERRYDDPSARALLSITPVAAAQLGSLAKFTEQVEYNGRRLAKLNVPRPEVKHALNEFADLLDIALGGRFRPAREQLHLATVQAIENAFYQVKEAESQAFFAIYRAELDAKDLDDLLGRFVRVLVRTFRARTGRLMLPEVAVEGKLASPLYIQAGERDETLVANPEMRGRYACYWSYPLRSVGLIQLAFAVPYPWLPRELALLAAVAERCLEAIERARLRKEVRRLEAAARQAEEDERRRIGRELHDEAGQSLMLLHLQLEMMEREAPEALRPQLQEVRGVVQRTAMELRRIVAALSPAVLERLGLRAALRQLVARFRKMHPAEVRLQIAGPDGSLPLETQEVIYRVSQECLQNIVKHSQATLVNLSLRETDKNIRLSVSDNGAGFRAETAAAKPMSFGLAGMRERAALLGGRLVASSAPGKGARVTLELPAVPAEVARNVEDTRTLN